ncbi:hypothetical protein D0Y65_021243 [Glycine soja]|uniref:Uncharacterized protein n=1 Tax=Glycine soja TaxID=3848 RepID=A0A445JI51_GLYSO|nr:hypothetical protein D0Y65_021243 [Glycine soja]
MLSGGVRWLRSSERFKFLTTSFSTNAKTTYYSFCTSSANKNNNKNMIVDERYRQLENLDMVTAAKILFSDPPKKRKFGYPFSFPLTMFTLSPLALFRISSSTFAALNMSTSLPLFGSVFYYHIWSFKLQIEYLFTRLVAFELIPRTYFDKLILFDFHLVQFFFACLPSVAVYLVAQYARYEMRKMEVDACDHRIPVHNLSIQFRALSKEVEQKRKLKEEEEAKEKEKEMELNPPEEKEEKSDPQLAQVKVRLEKLEEAVKEIVVETKKHSGSNLGENQATDDEKKRLNSSAPRDPSTTDSASNKAVDEDHSGKRDILKSKPKLREETKGSVATPNPSLQDPKGNQSGGAS